MDRIDVENEIRAKIEALGFNSRDVYYLSIVFAICRLLIGIAKQKKISLHSYIESNEWRSDIKEFEESNSLRSPRYIYNLLEHLGQKHCALCGCEIPELIQGAHIWPVADIKRTATLTLEQKIHHATDGENGLWLCENHHKLFDEGLIAIDNSGSILFRNNIEHRHMAFMDEITPVKQLPDYLLSDGFLGYLNTRNRLAG